MAYPVTFWRIEIIQLHKSVDIRKCFSSTGYIVKLWRLSHYLKFRQYTSEPKYPSTQTVLWVNNTIVLSWLSYILPKSWRVHYKLPPLYSVVLGTSYPQSCILYALLATDKKVIQQLIEGGHIIRQVCSFAHNPPHSPIE